MKRASIQWEIGNSCNLNCKHCFISKTNINNALSLEDEKKIIDYLANSGIEHISFSTREPFINKHFLQLLQYCENKDIMVTIVTNGTLITDDYIKQIYRTKIKCIAISLEGISASTNDVIRGKGTFDLVLKNLNKIWNYGKKVKKTIPIALQITLNSENCTYSKEMHEFFNKSGFQSVNLNIITPIGNAEENSEIISDKNAIFNATDNILECYSKEQHKNYFISTKYLNFYEVIYFNTKFGLNLNHAAPQCSVYSGHMNLLADGSFCSCTILQTVQDKLDFSIYQGNILDEKAIILNPNVKSLHKFTEYKNKNNICKNCKYKDKCNMCVLVMTDKNMYQEQISSCEKGLERLNNLFIDILNNKYPIKLNTNCYIEILDNSVKLTKLYNNGARIESIINNEFKNDIIKMCNNEYYYFNDLEKANSQIIQTLLYDDYLQCKMEGESKFI